MASPYIPTSSQNTEETRAFSAYHESKVPTVPSHGCEITTCARECANDKKNAPCEVCEAPHSLSVSSSFTGSSGGSPDSPRVFVDVQNSLPSKNSTICGNLVQQSESDVDESADDERMENYDAMASKARKKRKQKSTTNSIGKSFSEYDESEEYFSCEELPLHVDIRARGEHCEKDQATQFSEKKKSKNNSKAKRREEEKNRGDVPCSQTSAGTADIEDYDTNVSGSQNREEIKSSDALYNTAGTDTPGEGNYNTNGPEHRKNARKKQRDVLCRSGSVDTPGRGDHDKNIPGDPALSQPKKAARKKRKKLSASSAKLGTNLHAGSVPYNSFLPPGETTEKATISRRNDDELNSEGAKSPEGTSPLSLKGLETKDPSKPRCGNEEEEKEDTGHVPQLPRKNRKRKGAKEKECRRAKRKRKMRRDTEYTAYFGLHTSFQDVLVASGNNKWPKKRHISSESAWTNNGSAAKKKRAHERLYRKRFKNRKKKSTLLQSASAPKSAFNVASVQMQKALILVCINLTYVGWGGAAENLFGLANKSYSGICWGRNSAKSVITAVKKFGRNPAKKKALWQAVNAFVWKQRSDKNRFTRRKRRHPSGEGFKSMLRRKSKEVRDLLTKNSSGSKISSHHNSAAGSSAGTNTSAPDASERQSDDDSIIVTEGRIEEGPNIELGQPPQGNHLDRNYEDENSRIRSFRRCSQLQHRAHNLARNGLYLTPYNLVKCSGCQRQQTVSDFQINTSLWHFSACRFNKIRSSTRVGHYQDLDEDVVADTPGRVSDDIGDPPGQQSVYIPPGDVRNETYRLSTFEQFPVTCPISRKSLAKSGFYFTGFYDRVKCFACGRTVERWESRDNPAELRWHKPDCAFPRGDSCGNVPINDLFNRLHTNPVTRQQQAQQQQEQVLTQTDPNTGAVIRTVRYPSDLPERIRRTGGTFQIGPGNSVIIQSGPGSRPNPAIHIGNQAAPPPRRWRMANVVSADHRRFVNNLYLNRELDRLTSFARWPVSRPNVSPASLAKTGFFYLGDMDRTQCFSCGGVLRNWTLEDDAQEEHRTHFPSCAVVQRTENRNVPVPEEAESPEDRMRLYPCRYPANPHMRSEAARLETFDHRWPAGRIGATPAVIAQAGFFFLGERDRVKCFYCNGGLQNWEYDDMPWQEHAKWFPNCQFLLQTQGQMFVYRNLAMNPHLARPIIAKQEGATIDPAGAGEVARAQDIPPGGLPGPRQPSPPPTIIDPQEEMRKKKERIENIMKTSEICKYVLLMGFSQDVVRRLLEERIDGGNEANPEDIYESTSALLDDVMKKEEEMRREAEEEEARSQASLMSSASAYSMNLPSLTGSSIGPAPGSGKYNVSFYDEDEPMEGQELYESMNGPSTMSSVSSTASVTAAKQLKQKEETSESLQEQLQKIEEERMCKICFSNTADMVFIPCSHMCCCMECTQAIRQCPVCRTKIEKAIKTYVN